MSFFRIIRFFLINYALLPCRFLATSLFSLTTMAVFLLLSLSRVQFLVRFFGIFERSKLRSYKESYINSYTSEIERLFQECSFKDKLGDDLLNELKRINHAEVIERINSQELYTDLDIVELAKKDAANKFNGLTGKFNINTVDVVSVADSDRSILSAIYESCNQFVSEHPFLTGLAVATAVSIVGFILYTYFSESSSSPHNPPSSSGDTPPSPPPSPPAPHFTVESENTTINLEVPSNNSVNLLNSDVVEPLPKSNIDNFSPAISINTASNEGSVALQSVTVQQTGSGLSNPVQMNPPTLTVPLQRPRPSMEDTIMDVFEGPGIDGEVIEPLSQNALQAVEIIGGFMATGVVASEYLRDHSSPAPYGKEEEPDPQPESKSKIIKVEKEDPSAPKPGKLEDTADIPMAQTINNNNYVPAAPPRQQYLPNTIQRKSLMNDVLREPINDVLSKGYKERFEQGESSVEFYREISQSLHGLAKQYLNLLTDSSIKKIFSIPKHLRYNQKCEYITKNIVFKEDITLGSNDNFIKSFIRELIMTGRVIDPDSNDGVIDSKTPELCRAMLNMIKAMDHFLATRQLNIAEVEIRYLSSSPPDLFEMLDRLNGYKIYLSQCETNNKELDPLLYKEVGKALFNISYDLAEKILTDKCRADVMARLVKRSRSHINGEKVEADYIDIPMHFKSNIPGAYTEEQFKELSELILEALFSSCDVLLGLHNNEPGELDYTLRAVAALDELYITLYTRKVESGNTNMNAPLEESLFDYFSEILEYEDILLITPIAAFAGFYIIKFFITIKKKCNFIRR